MNIISNIETNKHVILEQIYTMLTPINFSDDAKLSGKSRYTLCGKFKQLERLILTTNQQWWDQFFLSQYIDTKVSPRGLRVMKECPTFLDSESSKEWASIAEFCTAKWMQILITHRNNRYEKFKDQILIIINDITSHQLPIPSSWLEVLKNNTKQDELLLIDTKTGKFKRDIDDYNSDRIFTWNKKHSPKIPSGSTYIKPTSSSTFQTLSNRPLPSLMSVQLPRHFVPHKQYRAPPDFVTNTRGTPPTPTHPPGPHKTKTRTSNKDKKNGLITALNQFYNRPATSITPMIPSTDFHTTVDLTPSSNDPHTNQVDQESSTSGTTPTVTENLSTTPLPSSFLVPSPPPTSLSRKRKLTEEGAEEGEENNHANTLKYPKL